MAGALLATTVPYVAHAMAPHLTCGPKQTGRWDQIPVRAFQPVSGLTSEDVVSAYAVDAVRPYDVAVTNGVRIQLSDSHGCDWTNGYALDPLTTSSQSFVGSTSSIVSVGLLQGKVLAAVQEGSGAASRPHIMRFTGSAWLSSDNGLPAAGAPRLLRTSADGRTAYLTISPNASGGSDAVVPGPLPTLPPLPLPLPGGGSGGGQTPTALLYVTKDAGASWALVTGAGQLPTGGTGFSTLVVDSHNSALLYGIVNGQLLISRDGGGSFTTLAGSGYTAVTPMFSGIFAAFDGSGHGFIGIGAGDQTPLIPFAAPQGITSAAYREGDSGLMVESSGMLRRVDPFAQHGVEITTVPAAAPARRGSLLGDVGLESSFHALSGHTLLRYVDKIQSVVGHPRVAVGDRSVSKPLPGTINPPARAVQLNVGQTATEDFTLALPKNPTPLDLFFLVDVSTSMSSYIDNLKQNIHKVVDRLTAAHIDLKVGIGTLGTAPAKGEAPYPDTFANGPGIGGGQTYKKPRIYQLIRGIGDTGTKLNQAINSVTLETDPPAGVNHTGTFHEGQLLALEQMVTGSGIHTEQDDQAKLSTTYSAVAPGQDAGWRGNSDVRRIVVLASDEAFDVPYGTPQKQGSTIDRPLLDYAHTLRVLNTARVGVFGITAGSPDSVPDMTIMSRGTHMFSPPGGVSCGGDPEQQLPQGAPLVCSQDGDFSAIIGQVISQLTDRQNVTLYAQNASPVLKALDEHGLQFLDVKKPNMAHFTVTVTCAGVAPGTYLQQVDALLRGYKVGTTSLLVTCVGPLAAIPPLPLPPALVRPPVAPAVQPPVPPPAPPPAAQPQPQPNPNINPLTAGVTQEQQEIQLALALNQVQEEGDEGEHVEQLAMVDRRKRQEVQAYGSLLIALTACAGLGLARLRTRTEVTVRTAR